MNNSIKNIFALLFFTSLLLTLVIFSNSPVDEKYQASLKKAKPLSSFISQVPARSPASGRGNRAAIDLIILAGEIAYLEESLDIETLTINGTLLCDQDTAADFIELRVNTIHINGSFQCGTSSSPYEKKLVISLKHSDGAMANSPSYRGIMVMMGGSLILNGERSKAGWVKLAQTANPGQNYIIVENKDMLTADPADVRAAPSYLRQNKFEAGDTIAIGPTGFNFAEAETFEVTLIDSRNPNKLYLNKALSYSHYGDKQYFSSRIKGNLLLDERAEVANLTRSIVIKADEKYDPIDESNAEAAERGGHVMVHHNGYANIDSVEFYKMGQAGIKGRYPFHWHMVGDASGQFIRNSAIHHSFQRCIVVHRTSNARVQNNVCFNFKGHGIFLEDGTEIGNKINHNLAILAKAPHHNKLLLSSEDFSHPAETQGRFPSVSAFWIAHPNNEVTHNTASGSVGTGFWMSFVHQIGDGNGNIITRPLKEDTDVFAYNTAHACKTGMTWDGAAHGGLSNHLANNPLDKKITSAHYDPPSIPTFRGLKAFKNYMTGIYFRGQSAIFKDNIVADNGWSFWHAYNQIIKDSVFIGDTANQSPSMDDYFYSRTRKSRYRKTGMVLYDGPFEIHNSDFLNFSTTAKTRVINGQTENTTHIPFTSTGGSNKFTNIVSGLHFSPAPLHRVHMLGENEFYYQRQILGNAIIRDLDGSFIEDSGPGIVIGKRSLGLLPDTNCSDGADTFKNFKVCESSHTEGSLAFMRWESPQASPWATPFVVRRSDNKYNYPKSEWGSLIGLPNNLFATVNSTDYSYEILPMFSYQMDQAIGAQTKLDANTESTAPIAPIVKIIAYGNNCSLGLDAIEVQSKNDLLSATETSFYSRGEEFYVRVIPKDTWQMITVSNQTMARDLRTIGRYPISCDTTPIQKRVLGKIERVSRTPTSTNIKGFACNYTESAPIQVRLYAYGPPVLTSEPESITRSIPVNTYTPIGFATANQASAEDIAFKCGKLTTGGRAFDITLSNTELTQFSNHTFAVKGLSNSGGEDVFLTNSNRYDVIPQRRVDIPQRR